MRSALIWAGAMTADGGAPAPTVSTMDPNVGNVGGGHIGLATIGGTDFVSTPTDVDFLTPGTGTVIGSATNIVFVGSTSITCKPPALASGLYDVRVRNPDGQTGTLSNGYRAWSPDELTSILCWWSILTGLTITSDKIEKWNDDGPNARALWDAGTNRPDYTAGPPAEGTWVPQDWLNLYTDSSLGTPLRIVLGGASFSMMWCGNYTSSDTTQAQANINCPLTVAGDTAGWGSFGHSGAALAFRQFTGSVSIERGSGLNDGQWRHMGWTVLANGGSSEAKAYHGETQQGSTHTFTIDSSNLAFNRLGGTYTDVDGFDGKLRSFVLMAAVASATELTRWHKWDRLTHGAIA